jgi:hypothetical protein
MIFFHHHNASDASFESHNTSCRTFRKAARDAECTIQASRGPLAMATKEHGSGCISTWNGSIANTSKAIIKAFTIVNPRLFQVWQRLETINSPLGMKMPEPLKLTDEIKFTVNQFLARNKDRKLCRWTELVHEILGKHFHSFIIQ